ncbi:MAG TPA: hypothetical protein VHT24_09520 [Pseudacidobacterium sp.]|jgi:hypothetical protein|nr:hypothetical protein [Pseudacidobacterium sp.]
MHGKNILLRLLAMPKRQMLLAAGIAVVAGSGFYLWSRRGALPATAVLSFDEDTARQSNPVIIYTREPAVMLAQSILSDETIKGLAKQAGTKDNAANFRSHLELTQPSANSLLVSYQDDDKELSAAAANAVANVLVAWKPSRVVAPDTSVPQTARAASAAEPPHRNRQPMRRGTDALHELEAQLAAVNQKLAAVDASPRANPSQAADVPARPANIDTGPRRALELQLTAAQKKLEELRTRYTDEYPDVENEQEHIAEIQQELASMPPPVSNRTEQPKSPLKPAMDANERERLSLEQSRLTQAIEAEKRRETAEQELTGPVAVPGHAGSSPPFVSPVPGQLLRSPFALAQLASPTENNSLLPGALAGMLCGFLYMGGAIWRYRSRKSPAQEQLTPLGHLDLENPYVQKVNAEIAETKKHSDTFTEDLWEKEIRKAISLTAIGRQEEMSVMDKPQHIPDVHSRLPGDEVSDVIRRKIKKDTNSWIAHTEQARSALAAGDIDKAITEIKRAITVAPEKLRPQLDEIATRLAKSQAPRPGVLPVNEPESLS